MSGKADLVPYFSVSRGRLAKSKDIREVLADVRMMRLVVSSKSKQFDTVSIYHYIDLGLLQLYVACSHSNHQ